MPRRRVFLTVSTFLVVGAFFLLTEPRPLDPATFAGLTGDRTRGERLFWAGGCSSCHADAKATGDQKLRLGGGQEFASPFGTFIAPNISPDPATGIGGWTLAQFGNALLRGVSPDGRHYYPVFPYASFTHLQVQDVADLFAYVQSLPPVDQASKPHRVPFPFSIRRTLGLWKLMFLRPDWAVADPLPPDAARGRYLAEALGHCGECHTPRNALGGMKRANWLAGGPTPDGKGRFPNITSAKLTWSAAEIADYLKTGFTPDFDSAGGHMALVVENMAHLSDSDRADIAAYLKAVPPSP